MSAFTDPHPPHAGNLPADIPTFRKPASLEHHIAAARRQRLFLRSVPLLLIAWIVALGLISDSESAKTALRRQAEVNRLLSDGEITVQVNRELYTFDSATYNESKKELGKDLDAFNKGLIASSKFGSEPPDLESLMIDAEPLDPFALIFFLGLYAIFSPLIFWQQPVRILLLRPFNEKKISKSIRRFTKKNLRGWGHVVTLSDHHINESFLRNSTIYSFSPRRLIGQALVLPIFPLVRLPPLIVAVRKEHHFQRLHAVLRNRYNLNYFSIFNVIRKIRCTDALWKRVVLFLISNTDIIIVDLTATKSGTLWEIEQLAKNGYLGKCIFIAEESRDTGSHALCSLLGTDAQKIYRYHKNGNALDSREIEAVIASIIGTCPDPTGKAY